MMIFIRFFIILSLLISFLTIQSLAQNSFDPGYYISNEGDSLGGFIRVSKYTSKTQIIEYKEYESSAETKLTPSEISKVCVIDKRRFTSENLPNQEYNNQKYFFEEIVKGYVSLYFFPDVDNKNHLYIKKEGELILISNKSVEIQPDLLTYEIDNIFRRSLNYYLSDCDKIQPAINSTRYTVNSMTKLLKKYHECLDLAYQIENEKDTKDKISIGISAILNGSNLKFTSVSSSGDAYIENDFSSNLFAAVGLFLRLSSNKVSPRLSFTFEPAYYQLTYIDKNNDDEETQKYQNFQFPMIIGFDLIGRSKNSLPLELGIALTSTINNPDIGTPSNLYISGNIDIMTGLRYELMLKNSKSLGFIARYYYGVSGINPPTRYNGKRNRVGIGLSYELFKN